MKILVLQLKRIGDLILTTPALAALRTAFPGSEITLVHDRASSTLVAAMPFIDRAHTYNSSFWPRLLLSDYDLCLDFTGNDRSALLAFLSKATRRLAFQWVQKSAFRPLFYNEFVSSNVLLHHTIDHYLHLLAPLGISAQNLPIALELPKSSEATAADLLRDSGINTPYAILHPGSARPEKYWAPERWAETIDLCHGRGLACVITGGNDPFEQQQIAAIKSASRNAPIDFSARIDLLTLASLIRRARLLLSVDTAAMHLGAAFATPQIALFGKTNPFHWHPRHSKALIVSGKGIQSRFEPRSKGTAMNQISTGMVADAITHLFQ